MKLIWKLQIISGLTRWLMGKNRPHGRGSPIWRPEGLVKRIRRNGVPHFPATVPLNRFPGRSGGLSPCSGQAWKGRPAFPVPADYFIVPTVLLLPLFLEMTGVL